MNEYLTLKDLRRDALKSSNTFLAQELLDKMNVLYDSLTEDEKNISHLY